MYQGQGQGGTWLNRFRFVLGPDAPSVVMRVRTNNTNNNNDTDVFTFLSLLNVHSLWLPISPSVLLVRRIPRPYRAEF